MNSYIEWLGRWHVALIHFPIALLVTAALVEAVTTFRRFELPSVSAVIMACIGAFMAVISTILGLILEESTDHSDMENILELHEQGGIITAIIAVLAAGVGWLCLRGRGNFRWPFRGLLLAAAIAVIITGHWGGALIYGDDYYDLPGAEAPAQTEDVEDD